MSKVMLVEDDSQLREVVSIMLKLEGYKYEAFPNGEEALKKFEESLPDLVIVDQKLPGMDGLEVLKKIKKAEPGAVVIIVTAYGTPQTAVDALKAGAYDYILKPFDMDELKIIIRNAIENTALRKENLLLRQQLRLTYGFDNIIGSSLEMVRVFEIIKKVKDLKTNILILGESGTGKELVARAIHYNSDRKDGPFVAINCGAIPENLMESELFGYKKGAFTGAVANKQGLFKIADAGTVFLDEIGELPLNLQVKLLRFLQDRTITPVGGTEEEKVEVRVIAASNKDLEAEVIQTRFREDLYYRLNVVQISLPPLRARREDMPLLAKFFLEKYARDLNKDVKRISNEAMDLLMKYPFPGNVRELENAIERAVALETGDTLMPENLPAKMTRREKEVLPPFYNLPEEGLDFEDFISRIEKDLILEALDKKQSIPETAKLLNLDLRALRYKMKKYNIEWGK